MNNCPDSSPDTALGAAALALPNAADARRLPVWRASVRMAVVTVASVAATALIATGMAGCADFSGFAPSAKIRQAQSLG